MVRFGWIFRISLLDISSGFLEMAMFLQRSQQWKSGDDLFSCTTFRSRPLDYIGGYLRQELLGNRDDSIVCDTEYFSVDESWLSRQPPRSKPKSQPGLSRKLADDEQEMIEAALRESGGRVSGPSGGAVKLGIPGSTLDSKIRSLKIDKYRLKSTDHPTERT